MEKQEDKATGSGGRLISSQNNLPIKAKQQILKCEAFGNQGGHWSWVTLCNQDAGSSIYKKERKKELTSCSMRSGRSRSGLQTGYHLPQLTTTTCGRKTWIPCWRILWGTGRDRRGMGISDGHWPKTGIDIVVSSKCLTTTPVNQVLSHQSCCLELVGLVVQQVLKCQVHWSDDINTSW